MAEAAAVEQFAQQHPEVQVVGLGTQDDFEYAQRFRTQTGVTHQLLWDSGFDSWSALEIVAQPSVLLYSADGREIKRWTGIFDEGEVIAALKA